jgi:electron transport complex protein RnfD
MRDVLIALAPAAIAGTVIFGLRSLLVIAVCVGSAVLFEALFNLLAKKEQTVGDLSAAVTGLLLALNLPVNVPVWQCVVGTLFAVVMVKCLFGGIGHNLVNPAITARVFMLVAFSNLAKPAFPTIVDTTASATPLVEIAAGNAPSLTDLLLGTTGGAIGETCAVALLIGFVYLLVRRVITWQLPVSFVGTVFVLSFLIKQGVTLALYEVLGGGLLIAAFFMITDYVSTPINKGGKMLFAFGCALITVLIRFWGGYPEGVSFAILLMNILSPYIEKLCTKKPFGKVGK